MPRAASRPLPRRSCQTLDPSVEEFEYTLAAFKSSLCSDIDAYALRAKNKVAHKWKATWRSLLLRETVAWRLQDLLEQSCRLHSISGILGARILLRSAFETLAVLVYLNQSMRRVVAGEEEFHAFSETTTKLIVGSRDGTTSHQSVNILTVLGRADRRYPGLESWYAALSESAHPNYEGMLLGYSKSDPESRVTSFENCWSSRYGHNHIDALRACYFVFEGEYNEEWPAAFEELERWIEQHDEELEASKGGAGGI